MLGFFGICSVRVESFHSKLRHSNLFTVTIFVSTTHRRSTAVSLQTNPLSHLSWQSITHNRKLRKTFIVPNNCLSSVQPLKYVTDILTIYNTWPLSLGGALNLPENKDRRNLEEGIYLFIYLFISVNETATQSLIFKIAAKAGARAGASLGITQAQKSGAEAGAMAGAEAGRRAGAEAAVAAATKAATEVATKTLQEAFEKLGKLKNPVECFLLTNLISLVVRYKACLNGSTCRYGRAIQNNWRS